MSYGPKKGGAFEREIAKDIVKAFIKAGNKKVTQRDCWRSINSGAHVIAAGDLEMSDRMIRLFPWAVECKSRKRIHWVNFLLRKKSSEMRWVRQAIAGAKKMKGLHPLLVIKENYQPVYAVDPLRFRAMKWKRFLKRWAEGKRLWVKPKESER